MSVVNPPSEVSKVPQRAGGAAATELPQVHAASHAQTVLDGLAAGIASLHDELATLARLADADEIRRRADWAAGDAKALMERYGIPPRRR